MSKHLSLSMIMAVTALGLTAPLSAQARSSVSSTELDAAVAERPGAVREAVRDFLATDQAREVADRMGVSVSGLSALVASLDEASLERLAEMAGISDAALAGGADTIVISATTVVIILLLIILLTR
jgi:transcriptional regulator with XRE-family HTH domain